MRQQAEIVCLAAVLSIAGSPSLKGDELPAPPPNPGIYGTQLYGKTLEADHTIEFYEFGPGEVAIRESKSADDGRPAFLDRTGKFETLADVYRRLNPEARAVPRRILEADGRVAEARPSVARRLRARPPIGAQAAPRPEPSADSPAACSEDFFGDGWGGAWFHDNFCTAGQFRWCDAANWGAAHSGDYAVHWSSWRQMEGDFNERGRILCEVHSHHWWGQTLKRVVVDYQVLPRHVEIWYTNDIDTEYSWMGWSTCGHLHVALLWNP